MLRDQTRNIADRNDLLETLEAYRASERRLQFALDAGGIGIWEADLASRKVFFDSRTLAIFGISEGEIETVEDFIERIVPPEDRGAILAAVETAADPSGDGSYDVRHRVAKNGGPVRWIRCLGRVEFEGKGSSRVAKVVRGTVVDITERYEEERNLEFLSSISESIRSATDARQLVTDISRELGRYLGVHRCLFNEIDLGEDTETIRGDYSRDGTSVSGRHKVSGYSKETSAEMMLGRTVVNYDSSKDKRTKRLFKKTYEPAREHAYVAIPLLREGAWKASLWCSDDKPRSWTSAEVMLLETVAERVWSAVERLRTEEEIRRSDERLKLAQEAGNVGIWEWDAETKKTYWSDTTWAIYGEKPRENGPEDGLWASRIHEDDRERVMTGFRKALRSKDLHHETEFRVKTPKGVIRWVRSAASIIRGLDGSTLRMLGVNLDITEAKISAERMRVNEAELRLITNLSPALISYVDSSLRYRFVNDLYTEWFGLPREKIVGRSLKEVLGKKAFDTAKPYIDRVMQGENLTFDAWLDYAGAGRRYVHVNYVPDRTENNSVRGFYAFVADQTELQKAHDELEMRVEERTGALVNTNALLVKEMANRAMLEEQRMALLRTLFTIQEDERGRIARDLHDQLGQRLTALRLKIEAVKDLCGENPLLTARVNRLQEIAQMIDREVSFLAWELRPGALGETDFASALSQYVTEWSRYSEIFAEFDSVGAADLSLGKDIENNLYRIAQEALNNAAKYANATQVNVLLEIQHGDLIMIVEDNGKGFDPKAAEAGREAGGGFGLIGMRERAILIGGTLEIESAKGKGTTVFVRIPGVGGAGDGR